MEHYLGALHLMLSFSLVFGQTSVDFCWMPPLHYHSLRNGRIHSMQECTSHCRSSRQPSERSNATRSISPDPIKTSRLSFFTVTVEINSIFMWFHCLRHTFDSKLCVSSKKESNSVRMLNSKHPYILLQHPRDYCMLPQYYEVFIWKAPAISSIRRA